MTLFGSMEWLANMSLDALTRYPSKIFNLGKSKDSYHDEGVHNATLYLALHLLPPFIHPSMLRNKDGLAYRYALPVSNC